MERVQLLGIVAPDPSVQIGVLKHIVQKLADVDSEFCYRFNAYSMSKNLKGAVRQDQVDDLWK